MPKMGPEDPGRKPQRSSGSGCGGGSMEGKPKTRSGYYPQAVLSAQGQDQVPEDRPSSPCLLRNPRLLAFSLEQCQMVRF